MSLTGTRTFVGFGFGAIQAGLFACEAYRSRNFARLVAAEVLPELVAAVRRNAGRYIVNIAHEDRVEQAQVGPIELDDPGAPDDRERLIEAVAQAEELATALPSVKFYASGGPGSVHRVLAEGLRRKAARGGPRCVIYAAENHNRAAEILQENVLAEAPAGEREAVRARACFLNTVIGKMSGLLSAAEMRSLGVAPLTPGAERAFLVESFNRILISRIRFGEAAGQAPFQRGITVFEEKDELLPFEEAKLYGHNATHALAAYLGAVRGLETIAQMRSHPELMSFLRAAFLEESGAALIRKYAGRDRLFTPAGYQQYADDLLARMTNPFLHDTVARVGRDPERKLGWDDRLIGTLRLALSQGIEPRRYALGAAAALIFMDNSLWDERARLRPVLEGLWSASSPPAAEAQAVLGLVEDARKTLRRWRDAGFPALVSLYGAG
jgi:mannitol-1-phosphate 5-dehydrogenase